MTYGFLDIAAPPSVKAPQADNDNLDFWSGFKGNRAFDQFTDNEASFIANRDSFYVATVSETGWPYMQHREGPPGFLKMLDDKTLGFADFRGNRQYISLGNLATDKSRRPVPDGLHPARPSEDYRPRRGQGPVVRS